MSEGQFWFVMVCTMIVLDLIAWRERHQIDKAARAEWKKYDEQSQRRHDEFMRRIR